ncbi:putative acyltransferase 3 [Megalodesulfovibrio gigas DSM 1382 = ATCC 19364]|uniref:Putative acyltransferase 3 n=2 Tax=Megalodesulfovibrio gigas TaxID=879 RepID=T2GG72_MEGG1|nr:putative acyltransferase 3 [Megalodesulfovibrio gigas DSM 1382 = ATCC 19364]
MEVSMQRERLEYMDWLRVLATAAVVLFHCCMFFTPVDWHMKNATTSTALFLAVAVMDLWLMPLFFLLSGMASWLSLGGRSPWRYVQERSLRLLIPYYGVGVFVLLPPQCWFDRITHAGLTESFLSFYPDYFSTLHLGPSPFFLGFWSGHLWFLRMLFLVSMAGLPIVLALRSAWAQGWLERRAEALAGLVPSRRTGLQALVTLTPFLLLVSAMDLMLRPMPGRFTWESFGCFLTHFIIGACLMTSPRLRDAPARAWAWLLGLALLCTLLYLGMMLGGFASPLTGDLPYWKVVLVRLVRGGGIFGWVAALLGLGMRFLPAGGPALRAMAAAAMPVYILHQTVLLIIGAFVIPRDWSIAGKFSVIAVVSSILIVLLVRYAIWPYRWVRFAFGMK